MWDYKRISGPVTLAEAREHAAELGRKFIWSRYLVAEVVWPNRTEVDIVEAFEFDDEEDEGENGEHRTVTGVMAAYLRFHEDAGAEVRSIAEVPAATEVPAAAA